MENCVLKKKKKKKKKRAQAWNYGPWPLDGLSFNILERWEEGSWGVSTETWMNTLRRKSYSPALPHSPNSYLGLFSSELEWLHERNDHLRLNKSREMSCMTCIFQLKFVPFFQRPGSQDQGLYSHIKCDPSENSTGSTYGNRDLFLSLSCQYPGQAVLAQFSHASTFFYFSLKSLCSIMR